ncbi:MAG: hypothetical protein HYV63_30425 [Candidatus Schekmanbacteria bacterium]|nr:hypothetical protein [Candidatus Schekmanbacteria bacterium]
MSVRKRHRSTEDLGSCTARDLALIVLVRRLARVERSDRDGDGPPWIGELCGAWIRHAAPGILAVARGVASTGRRIRVAIALLRRGQVRELLARLF